MPFCSTCGTKVTEKTKFCPECGKPPFQEVASQPAPAPVKEKKRKPWLGLVGFALLVLGIMLACVSMELGLTIGIIGLGILIFALVTGNVKMFG